MADAVDATVAAGKRGTPGAAYNVAGGNAITVAEVIEILGRLLAGELTVDQRPVVAGDARKTSADTSSARKELGYRPGVSLEEGLRMQIDAELERPVAAGYRSADVSIAT